MYNKSVHFKNKTTLHVGIIAGFRVLESRTAGWQPMWIRQVLQPVNSIKMVRCYRLSQAIA